jgi:PAS domain S-box-containing protein
MATKMKDEEQTKEQLLKQLAKLRLRIEELEKLETEHNKTEEALRKSEEMYKLLLKTSPEAVAVSDLKGNVVEISHRTLELFGYDSPDELIGKSGFLVVAPEDHQKVREIMEKVMRQGFVRNLEITFHRKDGTRFIGESNASLIKDANGKPKAIMHTSRDITGRKKAKEALQKAKEQLEIRVKERTAELEEANKSLKNELKERKRTEKALRDSEEMYRMLVEACPDSVSISDLEGRLIGVSDRTLELFGYKDVNEMLGKSAFELADPEDVQELKINLNKSLKEGFARKIVAKFIRKEGTRFVCEINASLIKDAQGNPKAIIGVNRDITDRKKAEQTLRESEELYKKLLKISPDIAALSNLEGIIIDASERTGELLRYKNYSDIIGQNGFNHIALEDHQKVKLTMQRILTEGFVSNVELIIVRKDGTRFIGEANATSLKDAQGKPKAFLYTIRDITQRKKLEKELTQEVKKLRKQIQQSKSYPQIIGNSPEILKLIDMIYQIAHIDFTVLIYGETGSGKDLIARAIHHNSSRKDSPFLTVNCAALPEQLIESELFGYVKGAFTGANQDKTGLFEAADKGTIFLNEIADIPFHLQAKLLEVVENQKMRRLGDNKTINLDVRIIAASNIDLEEAVDKGQFRKDLFYRLSIFHIKLAPLRERKEDIPLLIKHFMDIYSSGINKKITEISAEAMKLLCEYPYPGNVRQLENIIQHALIMAHGSKILPQHLPENIKVSEAKSYDESISEMEKQMIEITLKKNNGNISLTSKKLGIGRTTLYRKIKKYNIAPQNNAPK